MPNEAKNVSGVLFEGIKAIAENFACELVEILLASDMTFSVLIDKDGGITLDDCEQVSKAVSIFLDENEHLTPQNFILDVGSPGPNRLLTGLASYVRFAGSTVTLSLVGAKSGKKKTLKIERVNDDGTILFTTMDKEEITIAFGDIKKARIKN